MLFTATRTDRLDSAGPDGRLRVAWTAERAKPTACCPAHLSRGADAAEPGRLGGKRVTQSFAPGVDLYRAAGVVIMIA